MLSVGIKLKEAIIKSDALANTALDAVLMPTAVAFPDLLQSVPLRAFSKKTLSAAVASISLSQHRVRNARRFTKRQMVPRNKHRSDPQGEARQRPRLTAVELLFKSAAGPSGNSKPVVLWVKISLHWAAGNALFHNCHARNVSRCRGFDAM